MNSVFNDFNDKNLPLPSFQSVFGNYSFLNSNKQVVNIPCEEHRTCESLSIAKKSLNDELTGRWTSEEHRLFLEGIMIYGKNWKKIQPLIKTRTLIQIRTHAQKVFKNVGIKRLLNDIPTEVLPTEAIDTTSKRQRVDDNVSFSLFLHLIYLINSGFIIKIE